MYFSAVKMLGCWWFLRRENVHVTPQTNKSMFVADSACDVARCELCNQLSEPALSANPAVHLQGDLRHLHNVDTRFYCPQMFRSPAYGCRF